MKKYSSSWRDDDTADDDSFCDEDVLTRCAGPRIFPTVKADVDGVNEAQTAASRSVLPLALLLPPFPLLRDEDRHGVKGGIVLEKKCDINYGEDQNLPLK